MFDNAGEKNLNYLVVFDLDGSRDVVLFIQQFAVGDGHSELAHVGPCFLLTTKIEGHGADSQTLHVKRLLVLLENIGSHGSVVIEILVGNHQSTFGVFGVLSSGLRDGIDGMSVVTNTIGIDPTVGAGYERHSAVTFETLGLEVIERVLSELLDVVLHIVVNASFHDDAVFNLRCLEGGGGTGNDERCVGERVFRVFLVVRLDLETVEFQSNVLEKVVGDVAHFDLVG